MVDDTAGLYSAIVTSAYDPSFVNEDASDWNPAFAEALLRLLKGSL